MKKILIGILGVLILVGTIAVGDGAAQTYTISGRITDSRQGIGGIGGVTMNGLPGNPTPTTDANGYYSVTVPSNWSGTIKPQKIGYAIFPFSTEYVTVSSDQAQDYTAVLLPKVALFMQPTTYNLGDPINITMTLQNQGSDFYTLQGFMASNFALFLQFTDPDNNLITSNYGVGRTPPPPPVAAVTTPQGNVELLAVDYVESVPANWVLSMPFNIFDHNYYTLYKGGNYSVKAKISIRVYPPGDVSQTNPPYAPHDSGSSGDVESNIINFAIISSSTLDHITINPTSSTIIAGGSQTYTTQAFDLYNNSGDVTAATTFSITANASCTGNTCTALAAGLHSVLATYSGKTATASLQVNYNFAGFFSPIDNPPTENKANAGQAIPVKWRLTDANGAGISDPSSFVSLISYKFNNCDWTGSAQDPITESTSGASGLQYLGNGNWQFNWNTSKTYRGTCRMLILNLKDGTQHKAEFKFK